MKVCFIGLGSIGLRHLNNLVKLAEDRDIKLNIDAVRSGKGKELESEIAEKLSHIYTKYEDVEDDYDVAFVTNPTSLHYKTLLEMKDKAKNFFVEKPIFHTSKVDLSLLSFREDQHIYIACPMRYENTVQYVKQNVDLDDVYCARAICSTYLPDWRRGVDYRNIYSAHKDMGGGVSLDLIHEWDYLCYLLSPPEQIYSFIRKSSGLEIDSDDVAVYIGQNEKCVFELHLDYFGREEIRQLQLFKENTLITVDFLKGTIEDSKQGEIINLHEQRDEYQIRELTYFLDIIKGNSINTNDMGTALKVLKLAEGVI